ncbi:MAG: DUF4912 domain-containing protein, partial [bacterium]|nr:DUF4912 domain-containing protein [bacterium]
MAMRLESTSGGRMGSGFLPVHEGSQPTAPTSLKIRAGLPERYGVALLELLIVDPYFIFISWEITTGQLEGAHVQFGAGFERRRLRVLLFDADSGSLLTARELFGDVGRWFIELNQPGRWLRAELQFQVDSSVMSLNTTGDVFLPRDEPVEPQQWDELFVTYSRSEKGELRINAMEREQPGWPQID